MKGSLLIILCLFFPAGLRADSPEARAGNFYMSATSPYWPDEALVNVYLVRDMFTAGERQTLREAMAGWTQESKTRGVGISFVYAGETGGLIDCLRCLTITRQGVFTPGPRQRVTFNILRQDGTGRLISAWIAFERATARPVDLNSLMLQALARGFESGDFQSARRNKR
jgi:hypothetical protein